MRSTREVLHRVFQPLATGRTPSERDLAEVAALYAAAVASARPTLRDDGLSWEWIDAAPWQTMLNSVVVDALELLSSCKLRRVKVCGGHTCGWLFLDHSKNGSRRWCSMEIRGSRTKMRRQYQRKRGAAPSPTADRRDLR